MTPTDTVPPGYRRNGAGDLIAERNIPGWQLIADDLALRLAARMQEEADRAAALKADLFREVAEFVALVASEYDVTIEGDRGDVRIQSFDATAKIERAVAERITVGPQIEAAKALVFEVLADIADPVARPIAERAFRLNRKTGQMSGAALVGLISVQIPDERWQRAVAAVREALQADGTATYFRAYTRPDSTQPWTQIAVDFSRVAPAVQPPAAPPRIDGAYPDALERVR